MIIAVDFDGTIVEHRYPRIGKERPYATETLKKLIADGHKLILWTVREGETLDDAVAFCHDRGVDFWGVNCNPDEVRKGSKELRKVKADLYIDDTNIGGLPEWPQIYEKIQKGTIREMNPEDFPQLGAEGDSQKSRHSIWPWSRK